MAGENTAKECPLCASRNISFNEREHALVCRDCGHVSAGKPVVIEISKEEVVREILPTTSKPKEVVVVKTKKAVKKKPKPKKKVKKKAAKKKPKKKAAKKKIVKKKAKKKPAKKAKKAVKKKPKKKPVKKKERVV